MRYSYLQIEEYIADKITALCEKRDISKYRLSQFFREGNSENLTERSFKADMNAHIAKPIDIKTILAVFDQVFGVF